MNQLSKLELNVFLAPYTTLGVGGPARFFWVAKSLTDLKDALAYAKAEQLPWLILGGGSNVLIRDEGFAGLVIKMAIVEETIIYEDATTVAVRVGAGVDFDLFIARTVKAGWWGLENLSAIPGTVGATPVQNVGAYGVEVADCIGAVIVYDTYHNKVETLTKEFCQFGYRSSLFKLDSTRYIILAVTFTLSRVPIPRLEYTDLNNYFANQTKPSLTAIRLAIQSIRASKFPDWQQLGTAGSFFKNPIVGKDQAIQLLKKYPNLPQYKINVNQVKLPLGFILDKICGLKGYTNGRVGLYQHQALVLVAEPGASAREIIDFATAITEKVFAETKIKIAYEVTVI